MCKLNTGQVSKQVGFFKLFSNDSKSIKKKWKTFWHPKHDRCLQRLIFFRLLTHKRVELAFSKSLWMHIEVTIVTIFNRHTSRWNIGSIVVFFFIFFMIPRETQQEISWACPVAMRLASNKQTHKQCNSQPLPQRIRLGLKPNLIKVYRVHKSETLYTDNKF